MRCDYLNGISLSFNLRSENVDLAIQIMERLLPGEHLLLASAKRVKALILEEIALDNHIAPMSEQDLLLKSEGLHLSALLLARSAFGERNVQTAKHYGNLGRLYQSMRRFQVSFALRIIFFCFVFIAVPVVADMVTPTYAFSGHFPSSFHFSLFSLTIALTLPSNRIKVVMGANHECILSRIFHECILSLCLPS